MTTELLKLDSGASPRMLAVSASVHLIAILLLIVGAKYFTVRAKIPDFSVTSVRLVESKPSSNAASAQTPELLTSSAPPQPSFESAEPPRRPSLEIERLKTVFAKAEAPAPIQMKKRKQKPEKIEPKKKVAETKPKNEKPKPDPEKTNGQNDFLEKRLAAIKKDLDSKKSDKPTNKSPRGLDTPAGSGGKMTGNSSSGDVEISRWFEAVRNRINSRWSVFGDEQRASQVTIISVQLTDDGRLLEATIDSSSGDRFFDSSAMRAIYQASPFPPMPAEVSDKIRSAGGLALRFTPGGLQ
ncbi:MAG: cell envelope integrity protein TolA [Desulfomonilaceae bacterium]|jgi:TonB family protein